MLAALSLAHRWEVADTVHILSDLLRDLGLGSTRQTKTTHRPLSSSFLGLPNRILNTNHKKGGRPFGYLIF